MGGMAAAVAVQNFGFRVAIYEHWPELGEVGAGVTFPPNAIPLTRAQDTRVEKSRDFTYYQVTIRGEAGTCSTKSVKVCRH